VKAPPWVGDTPECDHGKMTYRSKFTLSGEVEHFFECSTPEPGQCPSVRINPPKKGD